MSGVVDYVLLYNRSNTFGLQKDAELLEESILSIFPKANIKKVDPREPPLPCNVCIHLEVPHPVWFSWARLHYIMVNPEWWSDEWNVFAPKFNWIFKTLNAQSKFISNGLATEDNSTVLHWKCRTSIKDVVKNPISNDVSDGWIWFIGGSKNKRAAAEVVLPLWKNTYLPLRVYSIEPLCVGANLSSNINMIVKDLDGQEQLKLASYYPGHICLSVDEGFGHTAAESEIVGAFTMLNTIDAYTEGYDHSSGIAWVDTDFKDSEQLSKALDDANALFRKQNMVDIRLTRREEYIRRGEQWMKDISRFCSSMQEKLNSTAVLPRLPPLLNNLPSISILTLVHGRPKFLDLAFHNLMVTDYPKNKIEWVIIDDSPPEESGSDKIVKFEETFYPGKITYIPLPKKLLIGRKRNIAVKRASHDILLMMDDDDHYPQTSFRRRVAWLGKNSCAVCTTIAVYDLEQGISAVNTPPHDLSLAARCSEATLTFTRDFWLERPFPDVGMGEGEEFLKGRELRVVEMPPQQIIVAFNHGKNTSNRRIPGEDATTGCFWGFPKQFLEFIHGIAGVEVEDSAID